MSYRALAPLFSATLLLLLLLSVGLMPARAGIPRAVATFDCVGLYWKPAGAAADVACAVQFRARGEQVWRDAMPLWFDPNEHEDRPERSGEYRGSIVGLEDGTTYEVRLRLDGASEPEVLTVTTWDNDLKIARIVELPERIEATLTITEGGSEETGYVVYQPKRGGATVIDGRGEDRVNVLIQAPWVMVRGLVLKDAAQHGVEIGPVQHVVVDGCDISGWGQDLPDGWGRNFDSAIFHETPDDAERVLRRIVIQNNELHHPRANSNSWMQARESRNGSRHPIGPQGITLINADGEVVIRHNRIHSDLDHMFNDAMGEYHNFGYGGFPARDSDVYGNWISHCWDDGIEIEGANMNVRTWGNVIDQTFGGIAAAGTSLGPNYIFRNIYLRSRKGPGEDEESSRGQFFLKLGGDLRNERFARGRIYVYHNTVLQPAPWSDDAPSAGAGSGLKLSNATKVQTNIQSRNNILWVRADDGAAVYDAQDTALNDYDHDLYNGRISTKRVQQRHGLHARPQFAAPLRAGADWSVALAPGTPGADAAVILPNFNDDFAGNGPDMGAIEFGRTLPAYFPAN